MHKKCKYRHFPFRKEKTTVASGEYCATAPISWLSGWHWIAGQLSVIERGGLHSPLVTRVPHLNRGDSHTQTHTRRHTCNRIGPTIAQPICFSLFLPFIFFPLISSAFSSFIHRILAFGNLFLHQLFPSAVLFILTSVACWWNRIASSLSLKAITQSLKWAQNSV